MEGGQLWTATSWDVPGWEFFRVDIAVTSLHLTHCFEFWIVEQKPATRVRGLLLRNAIPPRQLNNPTVQVTGSKQEDVVIIGAGPSGLTAGLSLSRSENRVSVLEKNHIVGGIARTETYKGFSFDMGGHRFFSKSTEINEFWERVLADRFLTRPRESRIYYRKKFFKYPLKAMDAFLKLGPLESLLIFVSCLKWKAFPYKQENTFEEWVTNRFGKRLFKTFFESYTEKVWGISCKELSADWAAQRIKGLSLKTAFLSAVKLKKTDIKTLIESFKYPEQGPGMMWEEVAAQIRRAGGSVQTDLDVTSIYHSESRIHTIEVLNSKSNVATKVKGTEFISSMPLSELVLKMDPPAPDEIISAARELRYRDFLTVCLIVNIKEIFTDNWIYIHDSTVKVGRIQNYKNWSSKMVPDENQSSLGLEYFCNKGDDLWNMPDDELVKLGIREISQLGLVDQNDVVDGCVFRVEKSYPVYDGTYKETVDQLKKYVQSFDNLQTIGRNGLHRYNNQDHAMMTGMLAANNITETQQYDVWSVNEDRQYHEQHTRDQSVDAVRLKGSISATNSEDKAQFAAANQSPQPTNYADRVGQ